MTMTDKCFLNWVRNSFGDFSGENHAQQWRNFFSQNIGMFLRNAVIYTYGMIPYYQISIINNGVRVSGFSVRLTPSAVNDDNRLGLTEGLLPSNVSIYAWSDVSTSITVPYWLLVEDIKNRLVWVSAGGVTHDSVSVLQNIKLENPERLSPTRPFTSSDLDTLIGDLMR